MTKKTSIRKTIMLVLLVCLVLVYGGGALVACNSEGEQKTGSGGWLSDDTYHWREWKVYEGAIQIRDKAEHVYDDEYDEDCNVCGYVRDAEQNPEGPENPDNPDNPENPEDPDQHVHGLAWFNTDPQFHWQYYTCEHHDDEQLNKDEHEYDDDQDTTCDVCGYVRTLHQHVWAWRYDESQHWEETTCTEHEPLTRYEEGHIYADGECEECGLEQAYAEVFQIYKTNAQFKGDEPQTFAAWMASLEEQGVDHVGKNAAGDGVFYMSEDDSEGELMYFAERNLTVRASAEGSAIEGVYFVLKAKVNGEYQEIDGSQAIASAATNINGVARLTFIPTWGFSGDEVEYEIALATDEEVAPNKAHPVGIEVTETDPKAVVIGSEATGETTFEVKALIGGELGFTGDRKVGEAGATYYIADGIAEGWYFVTLNVVDGTVSGFNIATPEADANTKLTVDGGEADVVPTVNSGVATWIVKIKEASEFIKITRAAESSEVTFNVRMEAYDATTLKLGANNIVKVNNSTTPQSDWLTYSLSELEDGGKYYGWVTDAIDGTISYLLNISRSNSGAVMDYDYAGLSAPGLLSNPYAEVTIAFTTRMAQLASTMTITTFEYVDYTTNEDFNGEIDINFTEDDFIYGAMLMGKTADPYHVKVTSAEAFTGVQSTYIDVMGSYRGNAVVMPSNISATTEYNTAPFVPGQGGQYAIVFENISGAKTKSLHLKLETEEPDKLEAGVTKHVAFDGKGNKFFSLSVERYDAYLIVANGERLEGLSFSDSSHWTDWEISSNVTQASSTFKPDTTKDMLLTVSSDRAMEFDLTIIKLNDEGTVLTVGEETPVTVSEGERFKSFTVNGSSDLTDALGFVINSSEDLKAVKVIATFCTSSGTTVTESILPGTIEITELAAGLPSKLNNSTYRYVITVVSEAAIDLPTFTIKVAKSLDASAINLQFRYTSNNYGGEIYWNEVPNAEKYEVYECIKENSGTPYDCKLVATINAGEPLSYYNRTYTEVSTKYHYSYFYYYIKAIDNDGEYLSAQSAGKGSNIADREMYTITVNVPATFEGWLPIAIYNRTTFCNFVYEKVELGTTVVTVNVASPNMGSSMGVRIAASTDNKLPQSVRDNMAKYTYDATTTTFSDNKATLTLIALNTTTITINLPEGFPASTSNGYYFTYSRWVGGSKIFDVGTSAYFKVEEGQRTVTLTYMTVAYQEGQDDRFEMRTMYNAPTVPSYRIPAGYSYEVKEVKNDNGDTNITVDVLDHIWLKFKVNVPSNFMADEVAAKGDSARIALSVRLYTPDYKSIYYQESQKVVEFKGEQLTQAAQQGYFMYEQEGVYIAPGVRFGLEVTCSQFANDKNICYSWENSTYNSSHIFRTIVEPLEKAEEYVYDLTIKDRYKLTVNMEVEDGVTLAATGTNSWLDLFVYKDNGNGVADTSAYAAAKPRSDGRTTGTDKKTYAQLFEEFGTKSTDEARHVTKYTLTLYMVDLGYEKYVFTSNINTASTAFYLEKQYAPITIEGRNATADYIVRNAKHTITVTGIFPEGYPAEANETSVGVYVYKDGVKTTTYASITKDAATRSLVITKANYSADSVYTLKADVFAADAEMTKVYSSDVVTVTFNGATASADVNIKEADKSEYYVATINVTVTAEDYNNSATRSLRVRLQKNGTTEYAINQSVSCTSGQTSFTKKVLVTADTITDDAYTLVLSGTGISSDTIHPYDATFTVDEAQRTITINITVKPVEA